MNKQKEKIKQLIKIVDYAQYIGFHPKRIGRFYTLAEHDSVRIDPESNRFFRNSSNDKHARGDIIDFVQCFEKVEYGEALRRLEAFAGKEWLADAKLICPPMRTRKKEKKMLLLPEHGGSRRHAYAYLSQQRCIDSFIIDYFFASNHLYEDAYKNCVFVSYDEKRNVPDFACRRGTNSYIPFKGDITGSDYTYCFRLPAVGGRKLYVSESVIDTASIMTYLLWNGMTKSELASCHFQGLAGVQKWRAIFNYLILHPEIEEVYVGTDNDTAGREVREAVFKESESWPQRFYNFLPPKDGYDWNMVVQEMRKGDS